MRNTFRYSLLALLVLVLAACEINQPPGGNNPGDDDPVTEYALYTAAGPLTVITSDGEGTGLEAQVHLRVTEAATEAITYSVVVLDAEGEPIAEATEFTQSQGSRTAVRGLRFPEYEYTPGKYTVVVTLDGAEVARSEHDLSDLTAGLPAPEQITAAAGWQEITVNFDPISSPMLAVGLVNETTEKPLLNVVSGADIASVTLKYDETFRVSRNDEYTVFIHASEARVDGEESINTRYLMVDYLPVELEQAVEPFVTVISAVNAADEPDYVLLPGFAFPLGAPYPEEHLGGLNFGFLDNAGNELNYDTNGRVWMPGDRVIMGLPVLTSDVKPLAELEFLGADLTVEGWFDGARYEDTLAVPAATDPLAPLTGVAHAFTDGLQVTWDAVNGADFYYVIAVDADGNYAASPAVGTTSVTFNSYGDFTVDEAGTYTVFVIATEGFAVLPPSSVVPGSYAVYNVGSK